MDSLEFDVVIVGAGLVGLALARALAGSGLRTGLVERNRPNGTTRSEWDTRVFAISPGSEAFLRELAAWPDSDERMQPVTQMRIFGDRVGSELRFSAYDAHVAMLARVVENSVLVRALRGSLQEQRDLTIFSPAVCTSVSWESKHTTLSLESGESLRAGLLVAADGADSWLRRAANITTEEKAYGQVAVVANFAVSEPHRGTAFQWFQPNGVLALLPLPEDRMSMVWSAREDLAERLLSRATDALCADVEAASRNLVGKLTLITAPAAFALRLVRARRLSSHRLALIGDAAHNLHPLAGQGVNLGFQDARQLASVLRERGPECDAGSRALLRRYERARAEDVLAMTATTHGLQRLFNNSVTPVAWLRNLGLNLTDRLLPLKALLVRRALG